MASPGAPQGPRLGRNERAVGTSERAYRLLLRAYPRELRGRYGDEMARCFRDLCREGLEDGGGLGLAALWARTLPELLCTALKERRTTLARDAYRAAARPVLAAAFVLMLPLLGMLVTDQVAWGLADFALAGVLLVGTGLMFEMAAKKAGGIAYRAASGVALAAALLLVWINLAVGVIGTEDDPANLMYAAVLAVGIVGAGGARFRPRGMARALFAAALAQAAVAAIALVVGPGSPGSGPGEILALNGFFVALFAGSALLFRFAAREQTRAGAGREG